MDCGDNVIVINASEIKLTGNKLDKNKGKKYYNYFGYPGGMRVRTASEMLVNKPEEMFFIADKGMLPKTKLDRTQARNLRVFRYSTQHGRTKTRSSKYYGGTKTIFKH